MQFVINFLSNKEICIINQENYWRKREKDGRMGGCCRLSYEALYLNPVFRGSSKVRFI